MYLLYKKEGKEDSLNTQFEVECAKIRPFNLFVDGEERSFRTGVVRLLFWLISFGKIKLYYVRNQEGVIMHTSCVISKCFRFPFMKNATII